MFHVEKSSRPDRCELCRYSITANVIFKNPWATLVKDMHQTEERRICKRFPPTPNAEGFGISPYVRDGDYCGEFQPQGRWATAAEAAYNSAS